MGFLAGAAGAGLLFPLYDLSFWGERNPAVDPEVVVNVSLDTPGENPV